MTLETLSSISITSASSGTTSLSAYQHRYTLDTVIVNSAADQVVMLPNISAADVGDLMTIVKLGTGKVTVKALATQYIADGSVAGTIFNDQIIEPYASITLKAVSTTKWTVVSAFGTWQTT
jgi:hypothetical protein